MPVRSTDKLCKAVDVFRRFMEDKKFGLCNGAVYKKISESKYTYVFCCEVSTFLRRILSNGEIANQLVSRIDEVGRLLSDPDCAIVKQIKIDFDYIECEDGMCFNISKKKFESTPNLNGTPRAYVKYSYNREKKALSKTIC